MANQHFIVGVHIHNRLQRVPPVQALLSEYGCQIRTRLGLHEASENVCSPHGLLLLELVGDEAKCRELVSRLQAMDGLEVQQMVFDHP